MANTNLTYYSNTAGNVPPSLANGQLAVNQADGKIFYRTPSGVVTPLATSGSSSLAKYATTSAFPRPGSTTVMYIATDSGRVFSWTGSEYQEVGPVGGTLSSFNPVIRDLVFAS